MSEKIIILDFGSQYTQLIARAVREANVFCEIIPYHKPIVYNDSLKGIILSGSPFSVNDENAPNVDVKAINEKVPVLGICYGAQLTAKQHGGRVEKSNKREYGRALLKIENTHDALLQDIAIHSQVWMSHGDSIQSLPEGFELLATTDSIPVAAFRRKSEGKYQDDRNKYQDDRNKYQDVSIKYQDEQPKQPEQTTEDSPDSPDSYRDRDRDEKLKTANSNSQTPNPKQLFALQFHPEVYHSTEGKKIIYNFLVSICGCKQDFTPGAFVQDTVAQLAAQIGDGHVIMALSGGVDSTVAATLISRAIGNRLHGIFVDNGLLRKNEFQQVLDTYKEIGLNVKGVDKKQLFYDGLMDKSDPEDKRKAIGKLFIDVFQEEANTLTNISFLGQGTIYPDVIESVSVHGPSATIKSHHNVGGLPEKMHLQLVEPLKYLFKDEVRKVGLELGIPHNQLFRHPFPGPGLAIRILGEVTEEKVALLQQADDIYIQGLKDHNLYSSVWQAGSILLPVKSVGVMGDERTYEYTLALRAVTSVDGMTADWAHLPYEFLSYISNQIINNVRGINRVVYDISSKPPATIEWE